VVDAQLRDHLQQYNLLEPLQSAYRSFHSTETALTKVYNDLTHALDEKKVVVLLLLDLSAAFDTIDHEKLLNRCENIFGLRDQVLSWIKSYITERTQTVLIGSAASSAKKLTCGVPQGSVLGPLLYIMYTTPLGRLLREENVEFHMYADDTQVYAISTLDNINATKEKLERVAEKIQTWMANNLLKLNSKKTELMIIRSRTQAEETLNEINFAGENLVPCNHARNIGVIFDSTLGMQQHVTSTARTLNFHLRNIARIRPLISQKATESLVHALISSRLDYGNALLASQPACRIRPLQLAQNTAARIVTRKAPWEHITPILKTLHWLPVAQRVKFKLCLLVFKCLNGLAPSYLREMLTPYTPPRTLRSEEAALLVVPQTRTAYGLRSFAVAGPRAWNELPLAVRRSDSVETFKKHLKTVLFNEAYN
jgi:hypothetical protein